MHILFVCLNSQYVHLSPAPYALAAGLAAYAQKPHTHRILSATVNESEAALVEEICQDSPDLVAFSAYIWNITLIKALLPKIKERLPMVRTVLGGPEASYCPSLLLEENAALDGVLSGEGEYPIAALLDALEEGKEASHLPFYSCRTEMGLSIAPTPYVGSGTPPLPTDAGYTEAVKGRIAYFEASRGCPFSCAFCLSGRREGVRLFDKEKILPALLALANSGCRVVKFVDRTFNANLAFAKEIWRFLMDGYGKQYPASMRFHFEIAGELLDGEAFSILESAPLGLFQLEVGLQSFSAPTLAAIHRPPVSQRLRENIRRLQGLGSVHIHIDLIAGLPYETLDTFAFGFGEAYALSAHMLQLGFLKLLHGAPMRENPEAYPCTYAKEPPYEVIETPWLSKADMAILHLAEKGTDRVYNSGHFKRTLAYLEGMPDFSPFDFFVKAGRALSFPEEHTVDKEYEALYTLWQSQRGVDGARLRDVMLWDFLAWNSSRHIPAVLQIQDARLKKARAYAAALYPPEKGERRAVALLSAENTLLFCRYTQKDSVTGLYPVLALPLPKAW
ncbi:MAG: DUF4080 domain-containing protein [Clostridia bacterium]|nr:DUF4080 domain-containing protein [Clostridia bacterium]